MSFNSTILNNSTSNILQRNNNGSNIRTGIDGNDYNGIQIFSICFAIILSLFLLVVFILLIKLFLIDEYCCRRKSNESYIVDNINNINQTNNETQDNIYEYL